MRFRFERGQQLLVLAVLAVGALPLPGALWKWHGLPPEFGVFPPNQSGWPKPGFSWLYFAAGALVGALILAFLLFPQLFGFRERGARVRPAAARRLPWWFWAGLAVNLASWYVHWFATGPLVKYSFIPLWWGFIVAIDGLVWYRTGGRSLITTETRRFVVITLVSMPAWWFFEFLNYYAVEFWVYPNNQWFSPRGQQVWFILSFSVVWPAVFEWFTLLHTFDGLWNRWLRGPRIVIPRRDTAIVFFVGCAAMAIFGASPFLLFPLLWMGPPLVLTAALSALRFWTPFQPIAREGNWSPAVLAGLASLANGFFWELWNWGSEHLRPGALNPNYWFYEIPYVNQPHFFSEMPVLGYFGYLPFGVLAWVCWLVAAHLLDIPPGFDLTPAGPRPPRAVTETPAV
jgi:hypothetical protein